MSEKIEIEGKKTRQNAGNKQTFDLTEKIEIEIERKTCQNAENKQTFYLTGKIQIETFDCFDGKN